MNIKIAVAHHKSGFVFENNVFIPVQVGAALAKNKLDMQGDDTGDNISMLNPYYCELSALYWLWKNVKDADYLGLCHYRRYFTYKKLNLLAFFLHQFFSFLAKIISLFKAGFNYTKIYQIDADEKSYMQLLIEFSNRLNNDIEKNNILSFCTKKVTLTGKTIYQHLSRTIGLKSVEKLQEIVDDIYPQYSKILLQTLNGNKYYTANMIILEKKLFNDYCVFIFDILEKHRAHFAASNEINQCYLRASGYIAEVLTDIFIRGLSIRNIKTRKLNILFLSAQYPAIFKKIMNILGFYHPYLSK
jgi:hypothetical protein